MTGEQIKNKKELLMKNSESREAAFMLVFEKMFTNTSVDDIITTAYDALEYDLDESAEELFRNVVANQPVLDEIIGRFSPGRAVSRIEKVALAVMRIAVYECIYTDIPVNIAVSEAVRIAQIYSLPTEVRLVNGILGSFSRSDEIPAEKREKVGKGNK